MDTLIMIIVTLYVVISVIIGISDLSKMFIQERELDYTPVGDIGYYIIPEHVTGVHNVIFLPSIIVILCCTGIFKLLNILNR